jgi:hypothetical protein
MIPGWRAQRVCHGPSPPQQFVLQRNIDASRWRHGDNHDAAHADGGADPSGHAGADLRRLLHGHHGRDRDQRGAAVHRARPARRGHRAAVGGGRLHLGLRRPVAHRRRARERLGGRRVFTGGLVAFGAASAACGLAPSLGVLVAARAVQGAGAAALVPSSLLLLQVAYPDPRARSHAIGLWGAIAGIGAASGPIVGGALVSVWSWRGVFFLNLPFAIGALLAAPRFAPATRPRPRAVDLGGQVPRRTGAGSPLVSSTPPGRPAGCSAWLCLARWYRSRPLSSAACGSAWSSPHARSWPVPPWSLGSPGNRADLRALAA